MSMMQTKIICLLISKDEESHLQLSWDGVLMIEQNELELPMLIVRYTQNTGCFAKNPGVGALT